MRAKHLTLGVVLFGALALAGCGDDSNTTGSGGSGNTGNAGGTGGTGGDGGSGNTGNMGGDGGSGGNLPPGASVDFEQADYTAAEKSEATTINLLLSLGAGETLDADLTVDVEIGAASTATVGADVLDEGPLSVTFPAGSADGAMQSVTITPLADVARETDETLVLELSASVDVGTPATLTITDDDALLVGHTRFISNGAVAVNMSVDTHDPETSLSRVPQQAIGFVDIEGAAYDSTNAVFYVVTDASQDMLGAFDPATGALTSIGPTGWAGIQCLAYDNAAGVLYGVDTNTDSLIQLDPKTGNGTLIGTEGSLSPSFGNVRGCAWDSTGGVLWAVNDGSNPNNVLLSIDTTTGAGTLVGTNLGGAASIPEALAYDPTADVLYLSDDGAGLPTLLTVDRTTGTATAVDDYDFDVFVTALGFDATNNVLYGFDNLTESTLQIDTTTAAVTYGVPVGILSLEAMDYDATNNLLYGVSESQGTLVTWNTTTGALAGVVVLDEQASIIGLAYDPTNDILYGYDGFFGDVVTIDTTTGALGVVGVPGVALTSLAFDATNNILYGSTLTDLYTIDTIDGSATLVGLGYSVATDVQGLTFGNGVLYAVEDFGTSNHHFVYTIDPATGEDTILNALDATDLFTPSGLRLAHGLGFDGATLWTVDEGRGTLASIDTTTGLATLVQSFAVYPDALTFDADNDRVYAAEFDYPFLWAFDYATGNTRMVGTLADINTRYFVEGLAYDPTNDVLYGVQNNIGAGDGDLISIAPASGAVTLIGALNQPAVVQALAWDDVAGKLFAATSDELFTVDTTSGAVTSVATFPSAHDDIRGLAFDPVTQRLFGLDGGLDADEFVQVVLVDPANATTTVLREIRRGKDCDQSTLFSCSLARDIAFAY